MKNKKIRKTSNLNNNKARIKENGKRQHRRMAKRHRENV